MRSGATDSKDHRIINYIPAFQEETGTQTFHWRDKHECLTFLVFLWAQGLCAPHKGQEISPNPRVTPHKSRASHSDQRLSSKEKIASKTHRDMMRISTLTVHSEASETPPSVTPAPWSSCPMMALLWVELGVGPASISYSPMLWGPWGSGRRKGSGPSIAGRTWRKQTSLGVPYDL